MTLPRCSRLSTLVLCAACCLPQLGFAQPQREEAIVAAPPNTRNMGSAPGGAYFVDEPLANRYDAAKKRLAAAGDTPTDELKSEVEALREEMEEKKVLIAAYPSHEKTVEKIFPLGDEQLVILTGDNVIVRGWDGPGIKCVVEKTILSTEKPADSEFDGIKVEHELTIAEGKVGLTQEKRDAQEREYLASENGRKLTKEQLKGRKDLVAGIHHSYDDYLAFQGREANTIQLVGLTFQEGNRQLSFRINSPGGGGVVSSQWQRRAKMTVYVPKCESLAVRGCQVGLDIQNVECDLVLTTHDSTNRKYDGSFSVRGVRGNVVVAQAPVRELSVVTGNVRITSTDEFVNSGTSHRDNTRSYRPYDTHSTLITNIGGNLEANILRTNLKLIEIKGTLDVTNEFGTTDIELRKIDAELFHRILSQAGTINITGPASVLEKTPIYAHTQSGRMHTNISREILDDVSFSTGYPRVGWHGLVTPSKERFNFGKFERPAAALANRERTAGLDVISRGGFISILKDDD